MSLAIDVDSVRGVLLADGWHQVDVYEGTERSTFEVDAYEYLLNRSDPEREPSMRLEGGDEALIPMRGATWAEHGKFQMYCPLTSILAVRVGGDARAER